MLRQFFIIYFFLILLVLTAMGFRGCKSSRLPLELFPDMDRQNRYNEQSRSDFFSDGRTDRPHVPGAVPFITPMAAEYANFMPPGALIDDVYFASGKTESGVFGRGFPIEVTAEAMSHGQELYTIFCQVCHGASGDGNGVLKQARYGYPTIASLLQTRLVEIEEGDLYNTITYGKNTMGPYGSKLRPEERWQVILYMRALQRANGATLEDVPLEHRANLGL